MKYPPILVFVLLFLSITVKYPFKRNRKTVFYCTHDHLIQLMTAV